MADKKLILFEIALIIASVFIFRSLWILLDRISWMNKDLVLWIFLLLGMIISFLTLSYMAKQKKINLND